MAEFLAMGGYAMFVWGSFGFTALVIVFNVVAARRRMRMSLEKISKRVAREGRRRSAGNQEVTES